MGEEDGGMKPIPVIRHGKQNPEVTADEWLAYRKQRHYQATQWFFLVVVSLVVLGLLTPLVLWLSRIALGG